MKLRFCFLTVLNFIYFTFILATFCFANKKEETSSSIYLRNLSQTIILEKNFSNEEINLFEKQIKKPSPKTISLLHSIIFSDAKSQTFLTLFKAKKQSLLTNNEIAQILFFSKNFKKGEICFVNSSTADEKKTFIIAKIPYLKSKNNKKDKDSDFPLEDEDSLESLLRWLQLLNQINWYSLSDEASGSDMLDNLNSMYNVNPLSMSADVSTYYSVLFNSFEMSNYFQVGTSAGLLADIDFNTMSTTSSLWFGVMDGWMGAGYSGSYNVGTNPLGITGIGFGSFVAGWKNYLQIGLIASTSSIFSFGLGGGIVLSLTKNRQTNFISSYNKEHDEMIRKLIFAYKKKIHYLKETKNIFIAMKRFALLNEKKNFASQVSLAILDQKNNIKKIRQNISKLKEERSFLKNKYFIEVFDTEAKDHRKELGAYYHGFGLSHRSGKQKGQKKVHRFYTSIDRAQELLKDGDGHINILKRLGKSFDRSSFPDPARPHLMNLGEEIVLTFEKTFYGSIILGFYGIPGLDVRAGHTKAVNGTFEFGIKKLPDNKLAVSFKPIRIKEIGNFLASINFIGPQATKGKSIALALGMSFIFDLNSPEAVETYLLFLNSGVLPISFSPVKEIIGPNETENLIDMASFYKKQLSKKGILLSYLEKINVPVKKFYIGMAQFPAIPEKFWNGLSIERLKSKSKVTMTDGVFAKVKDSFQNVKSKNTGISGTVKKSAHGFMIRSYHKDKKTNEYTWKFEELILQGVLEDSKLRKGDWLKILDQSNQLFQTNFLIPAKKFRYTDHKQERSLTIQRYLKPEDLKAIHEIKQSRIDLASQISGINRSILFDLVVNLENKESYAIASDFCKLIEKYGLKAVSAIHFMLGGSSLDLNIYSYSDSYAVLPTKIANLIAAVSNLKDPFRLENSIAIKALITKDKASYLFKKIKKRLLQLDEALKELYEDPTMITENDLQFFAENKRENKKNLRNNLLQIKKELTDLTDQATRSLDKKHLATLYKSLPKKYLTIEDKIMVFLCTKEQEYSLTQRDKKKAEKYLKILIAQEEKLKKEKTMLIFGNEHVQEKKIELDKLRKTLNQILKEQLI